MGRIKIEDLSEDHKISKEEMRKVFGGGSLYQVYLSSEAALTSSFFEQTDQDYSQIRTNLHRILKTIGDTMKIGTASPSGM